MRTNSVLRVLGIAFVLAFAGRFSYLEFRSAQQDRMTAELCSLVGNYLEVGSLREAFEGLQQGLLRRGNAGTCIGLIDNGRSFAPDCIDPKQKYQTTLCKAEGNKGVRAEIHYPVTPLMNRDLVTLWLTLIASVGAVFSAFRAIVSYLAKRITEELQYKLFSQGTSLENRNPVSRLVHWSIEGTGLLRSVRAQTERFEAKIRAFEIQVRSESALRARQETEAEQSKAYIEKVRQIRHDIRSPLSSLLALQEALESDELARQTLASSIRGIQLMLDDLNRVDQAAEAPRLTITEVVAEEVTAVLRQKFFNAKGVRLSTEYDSTQLSAVMAVPERLGRVLTNILENAFDAVSHNGVIRVHVSSDESTCRISIDDNGCGIPPDALPNLFVNGATWKVNGTGRGLYDAKNTVESWKGKIEHEPLARGTRFTISLPLVQTGVAYAGLPTAKKLYVIDDDPTVLQALRRSGFEVIRSAETFENGKALLRMERPPEVPILVDQRIGPDHLGTDLIAEHPGRRGIFLCTSDFDNPEVIQRARDVGVRIIPKPLCFLAESKPVTA